MKRKVLLGYCLILISWAYCASSEENLKTKKSITLGVVEFPPLVIKEPDSSRCHGVAIDATVAILTKMNYNVLVECMPPARLLITAVLTACAKSPAPLDAPPELIKPQRPM